MVIIQDFNRKALESISIPQWVIDNREQLSEDVEDAIEKIRKAQGQFDSNS